MGRSGHTLVVRVTGTSNKRVSLPALCIKPGWPARLIYRMHHTASAAVVISSSTSVGRVTKEAWLVSTSMVWRA
jgi:hypothetical protein